MRNRKCKIYMGSRNICGIGRRQQLLDALPKIQDPEIYKDIFSLGFIKQINCSEVPGLDVMCDINFYIEFTNRVCAIKDAFHRLEKKLLRLLHLL